MKELFKVVMGQIGAGILVGAGFALSFGLVMPTSTWLGTKIVVWLLLHT